MSRWQELVSISGKKKTKAWFIDNMTTYNYHRVPIRVLFGLVIEFSG